MTVAGIVFGLYKVGKRGLAFVDDNYGKAARPMYKLTISLIFASAGAIACGAAGFGGGTAVSLWVSKFKI